MRQKKLRQLAAYFPPPVPSGDEEDEADVKLNPPAINLLPDSSGDALSAVQDALNHIYGYSSAGDIRPMPAASECRCVSLINGHDNDCAYVAAKAGR